jgi:hypothetical protein
VETIDPTRTKPRHPPDHGICERVHTTLRNAFSRVAWAKEKIFAA